MELLSPAGGPDKLRASVAYGADDVYLAGSRYGLRSASANFTPEELAEGTVFARAAGVKVYLALNVLAHPSDFDGLREAVRDAVACGVDACVVSDPGVFALVREEAPALALHVSTQASTTNARSCRFWHAQGASRVVLARELTLEEIRSIRADTPCDLELETFVHGSMCVAHSGRCLLSAAMTGRDANRGRCAQSCRWKYSLFEEKRPGETFDVEQDAQGTYVMNSRDLCMVAHLAELREAGVASLKIEGRAKSAFYAAVTTKAYRMALDALDGKPGSGTLEDWMDLLDRTSHRPFSTGFYFDAPMENAQVHAADSAYVREADVVGAVVGSVGEYDVGNGSSEGFARVVVRNRFDRGERLSLLRPKGPLLEFTVEGLTDPEGLPLPSALHPMSEVRMPLPAPVEAFSYLARVPRRTDPSLPRRDPGQTS